MRLQYKVLNVAILFWNLNTRLGDMLPESTETISWRTVCPLRSMKFSDKMSAEMLIPINKKIDNRTFPKKRTGFISFLPPEPPPAFLLDLLFAGLQ